MIHTKATKVAAVGLAAALLLSGCGRDAENEESADPAAAISSGPATGELSMWAQGAEAELLPALLEDFEAENPDVTVNVTAIPWDAAHNKYQTAIAGESTPDIAQMGTTWMSDFSYAFDPTPQEIETGGFFPSAVGTTEIEGINYGVPWYVDTRVVYYRSDLAEQARYSDFPSNWDDFKAFTKAMQTEAGAEYGIRLPTGTADSFQSMMPFAWSNGVELLSDDGSEWTIDTPEMIEAMEYYQGFFTEGIADENANTAAGAMESDFVNGTTPVVIEGPFFLGQLEQAGGADFADKFKVATLPTKESATSFIGGANMAVFKDTDNRDAAWKLVQWLSQPEVQLKWYEASGVLPAQQSSWQDPSLSGDENLAVFGEQLDDTMAPPAVNTWTKVSAAGDSELEQIVKAGKDPATAIKELQAEAESIGTGN
ncbi:multiple sugar transport system substrate-binding protein [Arthrobacter sp. CAN_A214]|uniref:extracellular solute-binding protein n=1 Tax=Arthrobacter sp. CAN_A214 TaxID=2787720 RepID=UPI0018CBD925